MDSVFSDLEELPVIEDDFFLEPELDLAPDEFLTEEDDVLCIFELSFFAVPVQAAMLNTIVAASAKVNNLAIPVFFIVNPSFLFLLWVVAVFIIWCGQVECNDTAMIIRQKTGNSFFVDNYNLSPDVLAIILKILLK